MKEGTSMLPQVARAYDIAAPVRTGTPLPLIDALKMKRLLLEALPPDAAFAAYRDALNLGPEVRLEPRPIGSLLEAARAEAAEFHILHQGGERAVCEPPEVIGPGPTPRIEGTTRTVFVACFENAVAHSRSGAIELGSELCFDIQGDELDRVPVEMAFDPLVFSRDGDKVGAIIDERPATVIKLDRAWSLLGVNTVSFGHWIIEGLMQFLGVQRALDLDGVPLLIDEQMPPQHRQSLELLGRGRFPIVTVPRWSRVEAGRLWRASNWLYFPNLLITDQALDPSHFVMPMREVADVYEFGSRILDQVLVAAGQDRQVFVARPSTLHRRVTNFDEIEGFLAAQGFSVFFPEQHPFGEQIRTLRESRNVVIQSGSGALALLLARRGTKACFLSHPAFSRIFLVSELLKNRDIEMKIVSGPFEHITQPYVDQSDYRIPLDSLKTMFKGWMG
jgi:hypothetical protein